jgi:hypothetical protein
MSTYEHPTEQSDQHKSAKNQDEGQDGASSRSSGSRQGSPKKSQLSSGGVLGDFTETLRANDDDSSSSRSSGGGGRVRRFSLLSCLLTWIFCGLFVHIHRYMFLFTPVIQL